MPFTINAPYASAEEVLQLARVLCLDANISITGDLLADSAPGVLITSATEAAFTVTITTNQAHNFNVGDSVTVKNVTVTGYNGTFIVQTVPALNQFTYVLSVAGLGAGVGGSVSLSPSQGFILLNSAYRFVQDKIANLGYERPISEAVLINIPAMPASVQDPATQVWIGYDFYFDGLNLLNLTTVPVVPVLPNDMLIPLVVKERVTGTKAIFRPMGMANDGLSKRMQTAFEQEWEWRGDRLYMIGATQALDFWIRYQAYFPTLTQATDQVLIFHGANAIAYTIANRFSNPRGGDVGGHYVSERDEEIRQIVMRSSHKNARKSVRRQPYGGGHASGNNEY
jgi:hypothetical protein